MTRSFQSIRSSCDSVLNQTWKVISVKSGDAIWDRKGTSHPYGESGAEIFARSRLGMMKDEDVGEGVKVEN